MKYPSHQLALAVLAIACSPVVHAQNQPMPTLQGTVSSVSTINTASLLAQMNHGSANSDLVLVAAHRGYWLNAPENSNQALQTAFNSGIEAIEIDVRTTSDGQLVVSHDPDLVKETNGSGLISNTTLSRMYAQTRPGIAPPHFPASASHAVPHQQSLRRAVARSRIIVFRCSVLDRDVLIHEKRSVG